MKIKKITAREILDSRGWPTIACSLFLDSGRVVHASVPSGASVGKHEAVELRDGDKNRYAGKGVLKAIANIEKIIAPKLVGMDPDVFACDELMIALDGTEKKSNLGANAMLAVSMAVARAQAIAEDISLYSLLQKISGTKFVSLPKVMFNVLNGGVHAQNGIAFQEFMIMPTQSNTFTDVLQIAVLVYHKLKDLLHDAGYQTGVGDEGGFAPMLKKTRKSQECEVLDFLMRAIEGAGFIPGKDVSLCLDVAASQFFDQNSDCYKLHDKCMSASDVVGAYKELIANYPIISIEDGLDENDWDGWKLLTKELGDKVQLVGDDLFVSNKSRIAQGVESVTANAVLIKPNQAGTVSETIESIRFAKENNYKVVVSHRSGETCDTFISDLVVGVGAGQFKAGAPSRGERVAKYNRLLEIEGAGI